MLETEEGLVNVKTGKLDVYRLNQLADVIAKAQQGQQFTAGLLSKEIQVDVDIKKERLELDRDKFELQKQLLGINDEQVVDTNSLLRALNGVAAAVGIGEE